MYLCSLIAREPLPTMRRTCALNHPVGMTAERNRQPIYDPDSSRQERQPQRARRAGAEIGVLEISAEGEAEDSRPPLIEPGGHQVLRR